MLRRLALLLATAALALATGCGHRPTAFFSPTEQERLLALLPTDAVLLGEQHDAPEHQQLARQWIELLAERNQLAAVLIEMAEQGHDTLALAPNASPAQVRHALAWSDAGWPWARYGPVVMAAVRAGVPVIGANWPRARLREAMDDARLDGVLPEPARQRQWTHIDAGHCGLLPAAHLPAMLRAQIARDRAMADTLTATVESLGAPGRTVLLLAGSGHVHRALGVPQHLPPGLHSRVLLAHSQSNRGDHSGPEPDALQPGDLLWPTPALPPHDHCAELRERFAPVRP